MILPVEMKESRQMQLHDGAVSTTTQVWAMLCAARENNLSKIVELTRQCPQLITCQYNYTSPLHFAVREGNVAVVRFLLDQGALDPGYRTYPFLESLLDFAQDRGHSEIESLLKQSLANPKLHRNWGDTGKIDLQRGEELMRFEGLVDRGNHAEVEKLLKESPALIHDELAFWAEGILSMPSNSADRAMVELLLNYGAAVPPVTKWAHAYYFKHYEIAALLISKGMGPNHMNWQHVTLLHEMAYAGNADKARLLLDYGADIHAMDEEYCSTPLGFAARWGHKEMIILLLERGADPNKSGAPWSTPLAWSRKKKHPEIEAILLEAGATA